MGEGYHNFHHQFPMDYRNAFLWWQFDPTKWFIALCSQIGLANNLRMFPNNEILKSALTMQLKSLKKTQDSVSWPLPVEELPVVSWETCEDVEPSHHPLSLNSSKSSSGRVQIPYIAPGVWVHS